jgi:hypothetical protein
MPRDSQFGSNTPWAKAVAANQPTSESPKQAHYGPPTPPPATKSAPSTSTPSTSGSNSQFGSDTPWAKAAAANQAASESPKQGHYGPPAPPKQVEPEPDLKSATVSATPYVPQNNNIPSFSPPPAIKTATPDIILFDEEAVPIEVMSDLIFENIGGQELISIVRSDIVNGQKIIYQPIKNLSSIQQQYNPNNILGLQQTSDKYFAGFSIKLEDKIPNQGNGANGKNVYLEENGDLVIELINLNDDEQVETQITLNGTIYEANLGEYE